MRFLRSVLFFAFGFALSGFAVSSFAQASPTPKVINATGVSGALQALLDRPMTYTDQGVKRSTDSVFRLGGVDLPLHASQQVSKSSVATAGRFAARAFGPIALASLAYEAYVIYNETTGLWEVETTETYPSGVSGSRLWASTQVPSGSRCLQRVCLLSEVIAEMSAYARERGFDGTHVGYNTPHFSCSDPAQRCTLSVRIRTTGSTYTLYGTTGDTSSYDSPRRPATDTDLENAIGLALDQNPSRMPHVLDEGIKAGYIPSWSPTQLTGPSSVPGPSTTTTTQTSSGTQTTVTNNTYNLTYNGDTVTITNTTTKTTTNPDGSQTIETTTTTPSPDQQPDEAEPQYSLDFQDSPFPEIPDFYEQKYPDGFLGAWNARKAELQSTSLFSLVTAFTSGAPAAGTCPSWSMNLNMPGVVSLGTHNLAPPCEVWPFIKAIMIITALFVARRLIFGG